MKQKYKTEQVKCKNEVGCNLTTFWHYISLDARYDISITSDSNLAKSWWKIMPTAKNVQCFTNIWNQVINNVYLTNLVNLARSIMKGENVDKNEIPV